MFLSLNVGNWVPTVHPATHLCVQYVWVCAFSPAHLFRTDSEHRPCRGQGGSFAPALGSGQGGIAAGCHSPLPHALGQVLVVKVTKAMSFCFFFSSSAKVDLKSGLEECAEALNLFLSNKFKDALELLRPW